MAWKSRYWVLVLLVSAYLLCYVDRMVMASAIPFIAEDFHLSPMKMGEVLSAFFAGYALMQIPGGLLADRFGPRVVLTVSIAWWSLLTAATGLAFGLISLLGIRLLFGLGEGPFPPAASKALSNWFPGKEMGRANGLLYASTVIGATVAPLLVVTLIELWGWRSVFYTLFVPGAVVALVVWRYIRDRPANDTCAAREELVEQNPRLTVAPLAKEHLLESFRNPVVLWCAASAFFSNMVAWGLMNWLPTYLLQARGFGTERMGLFAALTNLAGAVGFPLGGYICDRWFRHDPRVPIVMGLLISASFTFVAARAPSGNLAVVYLMIGFLSLNVASIAIYTVTLVMIPKHSVGGAFGIVNTAGQLAGLASPLIIGYLLTVTSGDFHPVFYCLVGLALFAIWPASRMRPAATKFNLIH